MMIGYILTGVFRSVKYIFTPLSHMESWTFSPCAAGSGKCGRAICLCISLYETYIYTSLDWWRVRGATARTLWLQWTLLCLCLFFVQLCSHIPVGQESSYIGRKIRTKAELGQTRAVVNRLNTIGGSALVNNIIQQHYQCLAKHLFLHRCSLQQWTLELCILSLIIN